MSAIDEERTGEPEERFPDISATHEPIIVTVQTLTTSAEPYSAAEAKAAEKRAAALEWDLLLD